MPSWQRQTFSVVAAGTMGLALVLAYLVLGTSERRPAPIDVDPTSSHSFTGASTSATIESADQLTVRAPSPSVDEVSDNPAKAINAGRLTTEVFDPGSDGERREVGILQDGKRVGIWKIYDGTGALWMEHTYVDGVLDGIVTIRNDDGSKWLERNYRMGKLHGVETGWYSDGTMSFRQNYDEGGLNGEWETFYPNGVVKGRGAYRHGKFTGYCEFFYPDGSVDLDRTGEYELGKRVE